MPQLLAPLSKLTAFGEVQCSGKLGFGEQSLDVEVSVRPGSWRAFFLSDEAVDDLVEDGALSDEEAHNQLLIFHADVAPPSSQSLPPMKQVFKLAVEGAAFTIADTSLREALATEDGFFDLLDGVHGALANAKGLHAMLSGDGTATIWVEDVAPPSVVLIDLG